MAIKEKKPTIRIVETRNGYWGHNGTCGFEGKTRAQVIHAIKEEMPDEYEIIDVIPNQKH